MYTQSIAYIHSMTKVRTLCICMDMHVDHQEHARYAYIGHVYASYAMLPGSSSSKSAPEVAKIEVSDWKEELKQNVLLSKSFTAPFAAPNCHNSA